MDDMGRTSLVAFAAALVVGIVGELHGLALPALACGTFLALLLRVTPAGVRAGTMAALATGVILARFHTAEGSTEVTGRTTSLAGVVVGNVHAQAFGSSFDLQIDGGPTLEASSSAKVPSVGDRLRIRGRIEAFDDARNPGEPSMRALEAERGIAGRLVHASILEEDPPDDRDFGTWLPRLRAWASGVVHTQLEEPGASILAGALWGEKGSLPPEMRAEFADTGTTHILVTAGLHLGVIAALAVWLLATLGLGRIGSSLVGIAIVWGYAEFSGAHVPSLRAATMISFGLAARACGRPTFSWNALAAAAIVICVFWTPSVDSLSFALSFSCVAAILLFAKPFGLALEWLTVRGFAGKALALTFATQLGTWPLTAFAFLVFAPYAPLANALVVPVVGLAMLGGLLLLAATPVPLLAHAVANVEGSLLLWIAGVVRFVANLPGAHVVATPPPIWAIAVYDAVCLAVAALLRSRRFAFAALAFAGVTALVVWPPRPASHALVVTAIDVGQADSLLIRTPSGHAILIDGGGRLERGLSSNADSPAEAIGERTVVPFLVRQGIHHLDAVLVSHPHGDHVGGIPPVLRTLGADEFGDSGQQYPGHAYHDALDVVAQRRIPIVYPRGGTVWTTNDGVTFRFYGPSLPLLTNTRNDINNNSLVFRLEYRHFRMLFTGDAGAEAEARILASGADVRADVLKVGHHGSAYSSTPEFIRGVSPRYAIISVGRDNLFGHPAPSTIETLQASGAQIYRTDEDGQVTIRSDGTNASVRTFLNPSR